MGINNYMTNLTELFPNILSYKKPKNINTLCIDANGILHKICNITKNRIEFKKILISRLNKIIKIINPSSISIFIDGQAILAKANTQIKRRNKYLYSTPSGISPLNLTPGTPFMNYIDDTIEEYLSTLSIETYYSSSKENNEGELKLFEWLLQNNNKNNKICVLGNDSDLVVLALTSSPLIDLYIYDEKKFLSLWMLVDNLSKLVSTTFSYDWHPVRMDFVLLSLFQGNDYNKRVSQFKTLLKAYSHLQKEKKGFLLNKNNQLNLRNIKKLFLGINTTDITLSTKNDVEEYFKAIQWNINLYQGKITNRFIPNYNKVNIQSITHYIPNNINSIQEDINWLDPEVYTLLLMPSTGKDLLPDKLKPLMEQESPIKDLFPEPCKTCIDWKHKLKNIIKPCDDVNSKEYIEYKSLLRKTNIGYNNHIKESHPIVELPIERIKKVVDNIN